MKLIGGHGTWAQVICGGCVFLLLLTAYIFQVNASSRLAYTLRDSLQQQDDLLRRKDRLDAEIHRLQSLSLARERMFFLGFIENPPVVYLSE